MMRRSLLLITLLLSSVAALCAADITGRWKVSIATPDGKVVGVAAFWQNGNRVTGWLGPSESDPIPITTALQGNKLTIWTHPQPGRNVVFSKCEVTIGGDKMTGSIDTDKGTIDFVRESSPMNGP